MNKDKYFLFLCVAIASEITATTMLALSKGMSVLLPAFTALAAYGFSYYFLSLSLKKIPLGLAYALWAGLGIIATSLINRFLFHVSLSGGAIVGLLMIIAGVLVINLLAKSDRGNDTVEEN
ncbi:multidrug efflux SMR transporter [Erwinia sp. ACCC 02193]|uniref:Multidrug efflux SMR transporter n=1 Tax=Erwinia aeris TaxID=3239803 RepID=A0ABV4E7P1_9GAMM